MAKQTGNLAAKAKEQRPESQTKQEAPATNAQEPKTTFLQSAMRAIKQARGKAAHSVGYAYVPFQSKWFAHGATELANMILHGHPAPVYDNGSVFGSPKEADYEPKQASAMSQPKTEEMNKQANTDSLPTEPKAEELQSPAPKAEAKSEVATPNAPEVTPHSSVEQRMQEIIAMEAAPSMQQQQQMSH